MCAMQKQLRLAAIFAWRTWTVLRRRPWTLVFGLGLLAVELMVPRNSSYWILIGVTALVIVKGLIEIARPAYDDIKQTVEIEPRLRPDGPLLFSYVRPYADWETISFGLDQAIHDPELDAQLSAARVAVKNHEKLWLPTGEYEKMRALKVSTLDFDESKVRLETDLLFGATEVDLRRTLYSAFLVTNRLAGYEYRKKGRQSEVLPFQDIGIDADGLIPRLSRSKCSNHVGVDVLGISDGRIIMQRQSRRTLLNSGKIVGSGSGSADWEDLKAAAAEGGDLSAFVRYAMLREMAEELGLSDSGKPRLGDIKLIGYSRLTSLGGKPQFYGVARLPRRVAPRVKGGETLYVDDHIYEEFDPVDGISGLRAALDRIETAYRNELAFPLYVTLQMIRQWLRVDPLALKWLGMAVPHK